MPPTGILQTEMDEETLLELEIQQDLERINLDNDNFVGDDEEFEINNNAPLGIDETVFDGSLNLDEESVPAELQEYVNSIQKQRLKFEEELNECDALIDTAIASARGDGEKEQGVVPYEEWKELEEGAALLGVTVEEYKKKLLQDIENEPFELEEMDFITDESEFKLPETNIDEVFKSEPVLAEHPLCTESEADSGDQLEDKALAILAELNANGQTTDRQGGEAASASVPSITDGVSVEEKSEGGGMLVPVAGEGEEGEQHGQDKAEHLPDSDEADKHESGEGDRADGQPDGTVAVVRSNPLLEFEQYLREQFEIAEETFRQREVQLKQELEARREVEEKLMLAMEEQKLQARQNMQMEEQQLAHQKEESERKLSLEINKRQKVLEKELKQHEETIATLTEQLEEDRYQLERVQRAENERVAQQNNQAATTVQKFYRGYRARKLHQSERQTMTEKRSQRQEQKQQQRIEEIEHEIQQRKEEEDRKAEEVRKAKEEEERKIREEKERKEEERRKKEEEQRRKKEEEKERKRKEKEEQKRKEEEEKRRLKEEQERLKREEEERKKKEAEEKKRREEEEKQKKEEEERLKKEEEEIQRKEEEERRKREEEERRKREEEERKRAEEEERQRLEEERKRKEEEEKRLEEERKKQEEQQRLEKEERKRREQTDRENKQREVQEEGKQQEGETRNAKKLEETKPRPEDSKRLSAENGHSVSPIAITLEPVNANTLPESLEERRLAWMKNCLPWSKVSNEPWKLKATSGGKAPRRPASAKKLPALPENLILEAAQVASLRQVTTVELKDLPGHALSPLNACTNLKHLTLTHCGLIALDNLSHCKHLQCIDVQDNQIEYIDLKEHSGLYTLNLAHNKLSSIHGMDGCSNLRWLDVSHNKLTKLAGLSPLRRLHTLLASDNQLVSTSGLEACPTIQQLDISANYLTTVQGLDKLGLLLVLNVASNNLTQMPALNNNVLLQELILRENSIGPEIDLSVAWLPLLTNLDLSQNVIEEVTGMTSGLFVLKRLDLAVNQITDISSFLPALSDCPRLEDLSLQGNAVLDEENLKENIKNSMRCLVCLNGETLRTAATVASSTHPVRSFEILCLTQLQLHKDIRSTFDKDCRSAAFQPDKTTHICDSYWKFCEKSFKTAVEHRYAHEYGELSSVNIPTVPQTPRSSRPFSGRTPRISSQNGTSVPGATSSSVVDSDKSPSRMVTENSSRINEQKCPSPASVSQKNSAPHKVSPSPRLSQKEKFEMALQAEAAKQEMNAVQTSSHQALLDGSVSGAEVLRDSSVEESGNDLEMQPRGAFLGVNDVGRRVSDSHQQRPQLSEKEKFERALAGLPTGSSPLPPVGASFQQNLNGQSDALGMKGEGPRKKQDHGSMGVTADVVGDLMMAETDGLSRAPFPDKFLEGDDDLDDLEQMMEGLQFDIDGFLDLDQFDFDEDFLEKGWRPDDTPQFPQNYPVLARITPSTSAANKPPLPPVHNAHTGTLHSPAPPPGKPSQAWRNVDSPMSDLQSRVPPLRPPSSVASGEDSQAITTGRARREEKLAEEWGFKDTRTAEMMMQRAKKMKYDAERRKKLKKLDPQQRLQLFRKLEEVKGVRAVRPPPPRVLPRKEYFQAREEEAQQREMERQVEYKTRAGRTFEWIHTQVGDYEVSSSRINNPRHTGGGYNGDSPLLKTTSDSHLSQHPSPSPHGYSPMSLDVDSASGYAGHPHPGRQQRHSLHGDELTLTGHGTMLPPIKTGSVPSQRSREREKMSWRTEPVEKSVGWGGGKKRTIKK